MITALIELLISLVGIVLVSFIWTMYVKTYGAKHLGTVYDKVLSYPITLIARFII